MGNEVPLTVIQGDIDVGLRIVELNVDRTGRPCIGAQRELVPVRLIAHFQSGNLLGIGENAQIRRGSPGVVFFVIIIRYRPQNRCRKLIAAGIGCLGLKIPGTSQGIPGYFSC